MSQVLSYNKKTTKTTSGDWIPVEPYAEDDIKQIRDPNGGMSENPRTAIPSPFAQLDLVKNAFEHLASNAALQGTMMDKRLVSNALDVAQLLFDFENHKDYLHIVRWNREEQIAQLKSDSQHRLYGETLELFLNSDSKYNFHLLTDWYVLVWNSQVLGGTSPSSLTIAVSREQERPINEIKVEQGVSLFASQSRDLWERDEDFVYYIYLLFNGFPSLRRAAKGVYDYLLKNKDILRERKPRLFERITLIIPNLEALTESEAPRIREVLDREFTPFAGEQEVSVLGARFYHKRVSDIVEMASSSDFVIAPTRKVDDERLPLVLRNNFNGGVEHYRYIDKLWDSSTAVYAAGVPLDKRKLPDTSIVYPFLTTSDFLNESMVALAGHIDGEHYFDGNIACRTGEPRCHYLLPLSPLFFKYFTVSDLLRPVHGRNMLEMEQMPDGSVLVTLRVPLKKRYIELTRNYYPVADPSWQFDERRGTGRIVSQAPLTMSVFPFVRTSLRDDYTVQLFSSIEGGGAQLEFFKDGLSAEALRVSGKERTHTAFYSTTYYDVEGSFDVIRVSVSNFIGTFEGYVVPLWKPYVASGKELIFAVDFGTTNSHVEWAERGHDAQPLTFTTSSKQELIAPLLNDGSLPVARQLQRVEFLPDEIDNVYGFPLRSALAENELNTGSHKLFADVNIPFLYERQFFDGYDVTTNLKWMGDTSLSREFLRELILLIKAKVLLENGDLQRTTIVYFFPVSMGGSDRSKLDDTWEELYRTYIGSNTSRLVCYPESIAPAYYYRGDNVSGSSYVSIDIGGGTSDTVIYQPTANRLDSVPVAISSFRFAGDAIFGDAFTQRDAHNNPLIKHYGEYFGKLIAKNPTIAYLSSIYNTVMRQKRSQDVNAFLFSIENVEQLRDLREVDRSLYSYNSLLRNDNQRKLIFLYFYAAIIYYIAKSMVARGYIKPKQIYFSGTGSKILNIVGRKEQVNDFTQLILERVFGEAYSERFEIKIEHECPKQITCRGGIKMETQRGEGRVNASLLTGKSVKEMKYCHSMIGDKPLTIAMLNDVDTRGLIVDQVKLFNEFFIGLCDSSLRDEFGIDNKVFNIFTRVLGDDIDNYLAAGIRDYLEGRYKVDDKVEDVPFFYPIIGIIRHNLLQNLCNEVISTTL